MTEENLPATAVYAHRGSTTETTRENTLDAFALAAALDADGVELDVRRTADGALVVLHDSDVPGAGPGPRPVALSRRADLPAWVPTLEEALDVCAKAGLEVNVEVKSEREGPSHDPAERCAREAALQCAAARPSLTRLVVSSFSPAALRAAQEVAPELDLACLLDVVAELGGRAWEEGGFGGIVLEGVHPFVAAVDADFVRRAHDAGLAVRVWTVDDPGRIAELAGAGGGVDAVITNDVAAARGTLQER